MEQELRNKILERVERTLSNPVWSRFQSVQLWETDFKDNYSRGRSSLQPKYCFDAVEAFMDNRQG